MVQATTWGVPRNGLGGSVSPTDYAIRDDDSLDALLSQNSGPVAPGYAVDGTPWLDTSNASLWALKVRRGSGWTTVYTLNPTTGEISFVGTAKKTDVISLASSSPVADLTVPAGAILARFRGVVSNGNAAAVWLQAAFDAVPSFKGGASDYSVGLGLTNTTPGTNTPTTVGIAAWPLSSTGSNTGVPVEFEGHVYVGTTAANQIPRYGVRSSVFDATNGHRILNASGFMSTTIRGSKAITALRFRVASGSLPAGTFIIVEWY
jgi:hypothetical protein